MWSKLKSKLKWKPKPKRSKKAAAALEAVLRPYDEAAAKARRETEEAAAALDRHYDRL